MAKEKECNLCKLIDVKPIYWIGNDGTKYHYEDYNFLGTQHLPNDNFPYTVEYETKKRFLVCRENRCR